MGLDVPTFEKFIKEPVQGVFVEIGSDRFQGSTKILNQMAQQFASKLIYGIGDKKLFNKVGNR